MKHLSRPSRLFAATITLFSILFMQLAVAAYACPALSVQHESEVARMSAYVPPDEMPACHEMDLVQPSLCHAYHQADNQSLDKPGVPPLQPFLAVGFGLPLLPLDVAYRPDSAPANPPFLTRTTSPPLAIRHCCFRI
ncbi:hypothetical protein [Massilia sp. H6]|uniref:hypothetical protein n=1 Tax=Massilia sp. H6 TaxID=2970464 RepID=UPI002168F332|nr:hypothetical protein [Massilia sp. H6]UVW30643.1 hypothetical protein NRS07_19380 [Massilia sp. H6]